MHELLGVIEIGFDGDVIKKSGEFDQMNANEISELTKSILYILQDVNSIKSKLKNSGNFIKIRMRSDKNHYEVAVGASYIKVNKYTPE